MFPNVTALVLRASHQPQTNIMQGCENIQSFRTLTNSSNQNAFNHNNESNSTGVHINQPLHANPEEAQLHNHKPNQHGRTQATTPPSTTSMASIIQRARGRG
jgi:hypothetical protein